MSQVLRVSLGCLIVLALIATPAVYAVRQQAQTRKFRVVRPDVLYRSGQMTKEGLKRILNEYGIKTVISLRDGTTASDKAEEEYLASEEVNFVRILPSQWGDVGGSVPVEEGVRKFRAIMSDPKNYPVLMHCYAGIHRTGAYCAIYRMEFEHWTNARAITEAKENGYVNLDEELDILGFLEQYRPSWMPSAPPPPSTAAQTEQPKSKQAAGRGKPSARGRTKHHRKTSIAARHL